MDNPLMRKHLAERRAEMSKDLIIAAHDAPESQKAVVDVVLDGCCDDKAINLANANQRIAELEAEAAALRAAAEAVLYHDERGQGVGYSEAMEKLRAVVEDK